MKVFLTGGAGYAGSVVARYLLAHGHEVRVLDSLVSGAQSLLGLYPEEGFSFIRGDVRSRGVVERAIEGSDAVIHLAAIVGDPACSRQPDLACEVNVKSSLQLFEIAKSHGVSRFVFASTCSNYGRTSDPSQFLTEDSELRPVSLYAETKAAVERKLLDPEGQGGVTVTVLRFSTMFGLSPRMRFDLTVNQFTMELLTKRKLVVFGQQFWRPYLHVRDAARAMALVLETPAEKVKGRVFNVGDSGQNYQKGQLVDLIRAQINERNLEICFVHKEEDPRDYRVSFDKVTSELGFRITRTVRDGIREIMEAVNKGVITDFDNPRYVN